MELSIVIPMYNVEKYIGRCIDSCLKQKTVSIGCDYEIICVNDGSPDHSEDIAKSYEGRINGIRTISQKNKGLSGARNTGLKNAQGKYVWFVDSDDWIEENCLSRVIDICTVHDLDILQICAANIINDVPERRFHRRDVGKIVTGKECLRNRFPFCAPFSIYRRDFLLDNNLWFFEGIFHEDNEFTPRVYYHANRVEAIDDVLYFVYQNPCSITRTVNPKKSKDCFVVMNNLDEFSKGVESECKQSFSNIITSIMNVALQDTLGLDSKGEKEFAEMLKCNRHLLQHLKQADSWVYKMEAILLEFFRNHPIEVYKLLNAFDYRSVKKQEA